MTYIMTRLEVIVKLMKLMEELDKAIGFNSVLITEKIHDLFEQYEEDIRNDIHTN